MIQATYVSRLEVALTEETAMIRVAAPNGPVEQGVVTNAEVARLVLNLRTLRDLAAVLNQHVATLDARAAAAAAEVQARAEKDKAEQRSFELVPNGPPTLLQ